MKRPNGYDRARETPEDLVAGDQGASAKKRQSMAARLRDAKKSQDREDASDEREKNARRGTADPESASSAAPAGTRSVKDAKPGSVTKSRRRPAQRPERDAQQDQPSSDNTSATREPAKNRSTTKTRQADKKPSTPRISGSDDSRRGSTSRKIAALRPAGSALSDGPLDAVSESSKAKARLAEAERERARYEKREVRRFTGRARRRRVTLVAAVAVLAVFAILLGIALFSPALAVREIKVVGASRVSASSIQSALGDNVGTPLPRLDQKHIESEMKRFTLIESFSTQAVLPSTLVVHVVERTPVAVVPRGDRFAVVDSAGVELERADKAPAGLPIVDVGDGSTDTAKFHNAAQVLVALPTDFRAQVQSIEAKSKDDVTLTLTDGKKVLWGGPEHSAQKAANLTAFLKANPRGDISQFDVSTPDQVVTR